MRRRRCCAGRSGSSRGGAADVYPELARLAVVVPVGPGDAIAPVLRAQLAALPTDAEVRVVCATISDLARIRSLTTSGAEARWHYQLAPPGRATQQNAGAEAATRSWLWFLHADSQFAPGTLTTLADFLHGDQPALGYFDLRFLDDGPPLMPLNAFGAWLRSRWLGLPFGDQGLVLPRAVFDALGGFDSTLRCGEDHDLVWRARRAGVPLRPLHAPLYTSARKYAEHGWARVTARHLGASWRQARRFGRGRGDA